jgi:hypothetical protein
MFTSQPGGSENPPEKLLKAPACPARSRSCVAACQFGKKSLFPLS